MTTAAARLLGACGVENGGAASASHASHSINNLFSRPTEPHLFVNNSGCLSLSGRGYDRIRNMEGLGQLRVLYIDGNRLGNLKHMDDLVRLKELHAQDNRIAGLQGSSLARMGHLEVLHLARNRLVDLEAVLWELRFQRYLKVLSLADNPAAQEEDYRVRVIAAIPSLEILDWTAVAAEERRAAAALTGADSTKGRGGVKVAFGATYSAGRAAAAAAAAGKPGMSTIERLLHEEARGIERRKLEKEEEEKRRLEESIEKVESAFLAKLSAPLPPPPGYVDLERKKKEVHELVEAHWKSEEQRRIEAGKKKRANEKKPVSGDILRLGSKKAQPI
jgi:hypothetical protein